MGWLIRRLVIYALAGALLATLGGAVWHGYKIISAGYPLDAVPPLTMAVDVTQLHLFAVSGAVFGVALSVMERAWRRLRLLLANLFHNDDPPTQRIDTDRLIRAERSRLADDYLATLDGRSLDYVAVTAEGAEGNPDVENVITARGGRFTYRVLAYRHLTLEERAKVVHTALEHGHVQEPEPGGTSTILTAIGKPEDV